MNYNWYNFCFYLFEPALTKERVVPIQIYKFYFANTFYRQ